MPGVWGAGFAPHERHELEELLAALVREGMVAADPRDGTERPTTRAETPQAADATPRPESRLCAALEALQREGEASMQDGGREAPAAETDACGRTAAGAVAPLDLIEGHNSTQQPQPPQVLVRIEEYPAGPVRVVLKAVTVEGPTCIVAGKPPRMKREPDEQERVQSSMQRTRRTIRQRCMATRVDRLLTLTYRDNMQDRERCHADTVEFIRRARKAGCLATYVAVPELQQRGAWHVHLAVRGWLWANTLRRIWREVIGGSGGNIDISRNRHQQSRTPWRIAGYIAKYIGKSIEQAKPGERTFWASEWKGLAPICTTYLLPAHATLTQVLQVIATEMERRRSAGAINEVDMRQRPRRDDDPPGFSPPIILNAA